MCAAGMRLVRAPSHVCIARVRADSQDLAGALSPEEIAGVLKLDEVTQRHWQIQACSAVSGDGLVWQRCCLCWCGCMGLQMPAEWAKRCCKVGDNVVRVFAGDWSRLAGV